MCDLCVAYGGYCGSCDGSCWSNKKENKMEEIKVEEEFVLEVSDGTEWCQNCGADTHRYVEDGTCINCGGS